VSTHGHIKSVPPQRLAQAEYRLQPELYADALACVLDVPAHAPTLRDLATIAEGWRGTAIDNDDADALLPMYHTGNIQCMRLVPGSEHLRAPTTNLAQSLLPGDVVVTKFVPPRAAVVPELAHRHPADGNCMILRGLTPTWAMWAAWCLNQPPVGTYLSITSGRGFILRINQGALGELRLPEAPAAAMPWANRMMILAGEDYALHQRRAELLADVHAAVADAADALTLADDLHGGQWISGNLVPISSLLPAQAHLSAQQHRLRHDGGWLSLSDLIVPQATSRQRLATAPAVGSYIRLGDVAHDGTIATHLGSECPQPVSRVFAQPIQAHEVLLATIVTAPRAAVVDAAIAGKAWATDQWVRLRFRETPAAWAMILGSPTIAEQMRRMAVGTLAQFANPADLLELLVPPVPLERRLEWDRRERQLTERRRAWEQQWSEVIARGQELFASTYRNQTQGVRHVI
jgi:hypothetical protein